MDKNSVPEHLSIGRFWVTFKFLSDVFTMETFVSVSARIVDILVIILTAVGVQATKCCENNTPVNEEVRNVEMVST